MYRYIAIDHMVWLCASLDAPNAYQGSIFELVKEAKKHEGRRALVSNSIYVLFFGNKDK